MKNNPEITLLQKVELGVLVTVVIAMITFAFWLGGLSTAVGKLDPASIQSAVAQASTVPKGTIVAWNPKSGPMPKGWALCDGSGITPDLRGKFLMGVGSESDAGKVGGNSTHQHALGGTTGKVKEADGYDVDGGRNRAPQATGFHHTHQFAGSTGVASNFPPHMTIMFIMKL